MGIKRSISCLLSALCILLLILDGPRAVLGASEGIALCLRVVIPTLFPFFLFSNILIGTLWGQRFGPLRWLGRLISVPNGGESILIPAFLGGYPAGTAAISNLYRSGSLDRREAERLMAFCNNAGPSFLFGMVGPAFSGIGTVWTLWGTQLLGAWVAARLIPSMGTAPISIPATPQSISEAMQKALRTIASVCGWVLVFRILLAFLQPLLSKILSPEQMVLAAGLLELSNGCCLLPQIANPQLRFLFANLMLSLGGLCVTMQIASAAGTLSLGPYFRGKGIQAAVCLMVSLVPESTRPLCLILTPALVIFLQKMRKSSSILQRVGV